jgi:hypothetical protein
MLRDSGIPYLEAFISDDDGRRFPVWVCALIIFGLSAACYGLIFQIARILCS